MRKVRSHTLVHVSSLTRLISTEPPYDDVTSLRYHDSNLPYTRTSNHDEMELCIILDYVSSDRKLTRWATGPCPENAITPQPTEGAASVRNRGSGRLHGIVIEELMPRRQPRSLLNADPIATVVYTIPKLATCREVQQRGREP